MDDKKFEEIMHKYVSGKKRGKDVDFYKLNQKKEKKLVKKYSNRFVWATVSCIIVIIAITLSVVLPLTLPATRKGSEDNQLPVINYFEEENIEIILVSGEEEISSKYNISAVLPNIENQGIGYCILHDKLKDDVIGAYIDIGVFDEYFDGVKMRIVSQNNVLMLADYQFLPDESTWRNNTVKYVKSFDEDLERSDVRMYFILDGYNYYLEAQYYGDLTVVEILDLIF